MKKSWFKAWGWLYYPVSWQGVIVSVVALLFLIHIFVVVDGHMHSVSDTLYGIFPYWIPTILLWLWIAAKFSDAGR